MARGWPSRQRRSDSCARRSPGRPRRSKARSLDRGDLLNRIAFLYEVPPAAWPRALAPGARSLTASAADVIAARLPVYLRGLDAGRELLAARETADKRSPGAGPGDPSDPRSALRTGRLFRPARVALDGRGRVLHGPRARGPRGSGCPGVGRGHRALHGLGARLGGQPALAARQFRRRFARAERDNPLWPHGEDRSPARPARREKAAAGHRRKERLGAGAGAALRVLARQGDGLRPTDPLFAVLDQRLRIGDVSLERMTATSAPGPVESVPGGR